MNRRLITFLLLTASLLFTFTAAAQEPRYTLTLTTMPEGLCNEFSVLNGETNSYFNLDGQTLYSVPGSISLPAGTKVRLRPQNNSFVVWGAGGYYRFRGDITQVGGSDVEILITNARNGNFDRADLVMPAHDVTLAEHFDYAPDGIPYPNPQPNAWDAATGTLIVDNIERGASDAFRGTVPEAERDLLVKVIVSGTFMTATTMECLDVYPNLQVLDLSRTTLADIGYWRYREWFDPVLNSLTDVLLPSTLTTINGFGFNNKPLQNLTCYAVTPPVVSTNSDSPCFTNPDMTVFVPAEAVPLYQKAPVWQDFTILPIDQNAAPLNVTLNISNEELPLLRNMTIELENTKTHQVRRMVVGSRKDYIFRSLPVSTVYDVRLVNGRGMVLAQQQNVFVAEGGHTVTFASTDIHWPHDLRLITSRGFYYDYQDPSIHITWNDEKGNLIEHGATVHSVVSGQQLQAVVRLDNTEQWLYYKMEDMLSITVTDDMLTYVYQFIEVPRCRYQVNVHPLLKGSAYTISFTQPLSSGQRHLYSGVVPDASINDPDPRNWFNYIEIGELEGLPQGLYDITVSDRSGQYTTQTRRVEVRPNGILNINMLPNQGQWCSVDYTFTEVAFDDEAPATTPGLPDGTSLRMSLRNATTGEDITDVARLSDTSLRLGKPVPVGTRLELTVSDVSEEMSPATATATVEHPDSLLRFTLPLNERGCIQVSTPTRGTYVLLFGPDGHLVNRYRCGVEQDDRFIALTEPLSAGSYTVVGLTEGDGNLSTLLGALLTMADVQRLLTEGTDYVSNTLSVSDTRGSHVSWDAVPAVRSTIKRFIDNSRTYLNLSKTELVVGSYQTLRLQVAFREEYAAEVSDVVINTRSVASNTAHSAYVNGSTMLGGSVYTFGQHGTGVGLGRDYARQIRECWMAREATDDATLTVQVTFKYRGQTYTEYLCTDAYYIDDATLLAPLEVPTPELVVSGQAPAGSTVEVFDNLSHLIATTIASPNGDWAVTCNLWGNPLISNSTHLINANITIPENGQTITTAEAMVVYNPQHITPKTVEMTFFNYHPVHMYTERFVWDYQTMQPQAKSYNFSNLQGVPTDITFTIDLTNNDTTAVSQVMLWVFTTGADRYRKLQCVYDKTLNRWVAKDYFTTASLPNNIHVEVTCRQPALTDGRVMGSLVSDLNGWKAAAARIDAEIKALTDKMQALLDQDRHGEEASAQMRTLLMQMCQLTGDDFSRIEELMQDFTFDDEQLKQLIADAEAFVSQNTPIADKFFTVDLFDPANKELIPGLTVTTAAGLTRASLLADGYDEMQTTGQPLYIKQTAETMSLVSLTEDIRITVDFAAINTTRARHFDPLHVQQRSVKDWFTTTVTRIYDLLDDNFNELNLVMGGLDQCIAKLEMLLHNADDKYSLINAAYWAYINSPLGIIHSKYIGPGFQALKGVYKLRYSLRWAIDKLKLLKAGDWGSGALSIMSMWRNARDMVKEFKDLENIYKSVPDPCPREQDLADQLLDDIYQNARATSVFYINALTADVASLTVAVASLVGIPLTGGVSAAGLAISCALVAANYLTLQYRGDKVEAFMEGARYKRDQLECKKRDLKPGDEVDGCWRDDGDNYNIDSGKAGANLFKRNTKAGRRLLNFLSWLTGDDGGDGANCGPKPGGGDDGGDSGNGSGRRGGNRGGNRGGRNGGDFPGGSTPILDPSGYVYEAVADNRVQGATATIYYKEEYEDMYGDKRERTVVWNAEDYAQQNPLFTDENGEYAWDVPQGLWQVRFEKQGYQTTTTEWLPVPPPQLDINVPMSQFTQPVVQRARATEQGINMSFDKWMRPQTLTTEAITVTRGEQVLEGTLQMLDQTWSPDSVAYVRTLRFVPTDPLALGQQLTLTVAATVESYAGISMAEAYTQSFDVEQVVDTIAADSLVTMLYGQKQTITVQALPAAAASGKVLTITSMADEIAKTDVQRVTLGADGKATITITGSLLGTTGLRLAIEQDDVESLVMVGVKEKNDFICAEPKASILSDSEVDYGTRLYLSTTTPGASIIYTLDGSCLCSDSGTLRVYDPLKGIILDQDTYEVTLRCMAVAEGLEDSDEAVFFFRIRQNKPEETVTITIQTADAGYCTFYDSQYAYTLPEGLTASVVSGLSGGRLTYQPLTDNIIPRATAVLIEATPKQAATYTLTSTADDNATPVSVNLLYGRDDSGWTVVEGDNLYYKLSYGPSGTVLAQRFGWFWGDPNGGPFITGGQHKGWLALPRAANARAFLITGEATDIDSPSLATPQSTPIYDLQGRSLDGVRQPGIYILGDRKILVK